MNGITGSSADFIRFGTAKSMKNFLIFVFSKSIMN